MCGIILTWNGVEGIIASEGEQYWFTIANWKGDSAPKLDMALSLTLANGTVTRVEPLVDGKVTKEKLAQAGAHGSRIASGILSTAGRNTAIAYAVFAIGALFFIFVSIRNPVNHQIVKTSMAAAVNGLGPVPPSNGGFGLLLVAVAILSIGVPYFFKSRYAPFAYCVPLLVALYAAASAYKAYSNLRSEIGAATLGTLTFGFSSGIGATFAVLAGAFMAWRGYELFRSEGC